ncbi:phospholipid-binding protein MlaC [Azonexus caeni]|jgi:phospholipid transport system substrate-binding protein|uniref:MlaC/ttg2D family ABC transporter substrate-binding protein n=1 Tax=Azonexus caeni TaxID=266126 RepID=UPI002BCE0C12|nr:ABC transporter substrate-binding protein [Azonexus sp.]
MIKRLLAVCLACFLAAPLFAAEAPDALIRRVSEEVLEIVRQDKDIRNGDIQKISALVDAKVLPYFNFQRMTSLAVGRDWRSANPAQKNRLAEEFKNLLVRTYSNALSSYSNQRIVFKPFKMKSGETEVLVRSEVTQPGSQPVQIDYWLEQSGDNWKVFDVVVAGISLVTNYREQFANEVRAGGIDGLIASLAAKNKSLEVAAAAKNGKK